MDSEMGRRILRVESGRYQIAAERDFESEGELHRAIAAHPEVLPSEDLDLGPLIPIANELDLGAGPLDLLCADERGRVVLVEFKKGSAGSNVRQVIAQMLDYGSALWGTSVDVLEHRASAVEPRFEGSLADHAVQRFSDLGLAERFDEEAFLAGLQNGLELGDFVFMYVAKDLDRKTRRVMSYLAEGPRMKFFAVEVDLFDFGSEGDNAAVLVPRTAFVPPSVAEKGTSSRRDGKPLAELFEEASDEVHELHARLASIVEEVGGVVDDAERGRHYRPARGRYGLYVLPHYGKVHIHIGSFKEREEDELYEQFRTVIRDLDPSRKEPAPTEPGITVGALLDNWDRAERELIRPFLEGRVRHVEITP